MTRQSAVEILTAGLGQLISVTDVRHNGIRHCRLSRLHLTNGWNYSEELIIERDNWLDLVAYVFPDVKDNYEIQSDFIKPGYLSRLSDERKARRLKQKNSRRTVLQDSLPARDKDSGISESNRESP